MIQRLGQKNAQRAFAPANATGKRRIGSSFYRGDTINFTPYSEDFEKADFLQDYLLKGWTPAAPVLTKGMKITAFGSCFAVHITEHLSKIGYDLARDRDPGIYVSAMGEGLVNTHAILGQFEWAFLNKTQPVELWHGFKAEGYGYDEDIRLRTRAIFSETDFFIITLGLSEVWYDEVSGGVFWRAVPIDSFDPSRHKFRVSTISETKENIHRIYALIREFVPGAKVLFTLSPIPLAATFRPVSCLTANSASKAVLRGALDEVLRERADDLNSRLFYFPSYEIVQELFPDRFQRDGRHPTVGIVPVIMKIFEATYCEAGASFDEVNAEFVEARKQNIRGIRAKVKQTRNPADGDGPDIDALKKRKREKRLAGKRGRLSTDS